jgi:broad specificity phosphatase PhoE
MAKSDDQQALPHIDDATTAFSHVPEHGFSLFLAKRTKLVHFIRHAEGLHNQANREAGDDSPVTFSTDGSWKYLDAKLSETGIDQCVAARTGLLQNVNPEIILVSPLTRTLQTAHVMFGGSGNIPFMVHDLCRERSGKYTCDKRRSKTEIMEELAPLYHYTNDRIDFESFGYPTEDDENWSETREPSEQVTKRAIDFVQWLATRPEQEIAVVTHSSWLKHLFHAFGQRLADKDMETLHRVAGNAEVRSVTLALHRGFYPDGKWEDDVFIPRDHSFRRGKWAPAHGQISRMHKRLSKSSGAASKRELEVEDSMPL